MARTIFIKVRVTPEERAEWLQAANARGTTLSKLIRSNLERIAQNEQRKEAAK